MNTNKIILPTHHISLLALFYAAHCHKHQQDKNHDSENASQNLVKQFTARLSTVS